MGKTSKIILSITAGIIAAVGIVSAVVISFNNDEPLSDVTVSATEKSTVSDVTVAPTTESTTESTTENTTVNTTESTNVSTQDIANLILGKWTDSANMSGYEFYSDGSVEMTYVNLVVPIINLPVNGTSKGVYVLDGNKLTTKFSIYSATIEKSYTVSVENNTLSMRDTEDGDTATYAKTASSSTEGTTTSSQEYVSYADEIVGTWDRSDGKVTYVFKENGLLDVTLSDAMINSLGNSQISGSYSGVFLTDDNSLIIQYTIGESKVTEIYTFSLEKNNLTLTDSVGGSSFFTRAGTSSSASSGVSEGILGKWTDGANMSGYEFKEGGVVVLTYLNFTVPVINMPITGSYNGTYSTMGDSITISYSIYGSSIVDTFEYEINGNTLTLLSPDGDVSTYIRN